MAKTKAADAVEAVAVATRAEEERARSLFIYWSKTVILKVEDLPDLSKVGEPEKKHHGPLARMLYWQQSSSMGDAQLPFTFTEMGTSTEIAFDLVGRTVWEKFFGKDDIEDSNVCPMQLRVVMFQQLSTYDNALSIKKKNAAEEAAAKEIWESAGLRLRKERSKLRNSPYGA